MVFTFGAMVAGYQLARASICAASDDLLRRVRGAVINMQGKAFPNTNLP
jgi:hypothetical protein